MITSNWPNDIFAYTEKAVSFFHNVVYRSLDSHRQIRLLMVSSQCIMSSVISAVYSPSVYRLYNQRLLVTDNNLPHFNRFITFLLYATQVIAINQALTNRSISLLPWLKGNYLIKAFINHILFVNQEHHNDALRLIIVERQG